MRYARIIGAAAVSLILALAASVLGGWLPLIVSVAMAVVIAVGWPAATGINARRRHNVIIAVAGVIACSLVTFVPDQQLIWLPAVVGVAFMAVCVAELVRGEGAKGRLNPLWPPSQAYSPLSVPPAGSAWATWKNCTDWEPG